jgi:hypothetical protein
MILQGLASWFGKNSLPRWILIVTALVELLLCVEYHEQRWDTSLALQRLEREHEGEGLVIQCNGLGYYAWLRSLLIDQDWNFDNEFDDHNLYNDYVPPPMLSDAYWEKGEPMVRWTSLFLGIDSSAGPSCAESSEITPWAMGIGRVFVALPGIGGDDIVGHYVCWIAVHIWDMPVKGASW